MTVLEDERLIHEDLERLEQAITDRVTTEAKHDRERLRRSHEIAKMLERHQALARRLHDIYTDADGSRAKDIQAISTGDPFAEFYSRLSGIRETHKRYPNRPVENLEKAYRRQTPNDDPMGVNIDAMFSSEEGYGKYFDLNALHSQYINLPAFDSSSHRRPTYLQYLEQFDVFVPPVSPLQKKDKLTDAYFKYVGELASYLENFMRKVKPLDDLNKFFAAFAQEFEEAWNKREIAGWNEKYIATEGHAIWCEICEKEFNNPNTYEHHLSASKHIKNAERKAKAQADGADSSALSTMSAGRLKEKAIAEREFRIKKAAAAMKIQRSDTVQNVVRRQGMTEKEREEELEALNKIGLEDEEDTLGVDVDEDADDDGQIHNPLKLPLAWDGKPIPFWLYKLHGLGVEFPCEICGNYTYMGRRAFDKHFNESRHIYGLKCLGITNSSMFRDITSIKDAEALDRKIKADKAKEEELEKNVVEMEDRYGNVMPEKVYNDLLKQGLL